MISAGANLLAVSATPFPGDLGGELVPRASRGVDGQCTVMVVAGPQKLNKRAFYV